MNERKLYLSSIDIMGISGFLLWLLTLFLRRYYSINEILPIFCFMPNFAGGWTATATFKQFFFPIYSKKPLSDINFSKKTLFFICIAVIILSAINELLPFSSSFDVYDMLATVLAEIIIFIIPIILKEKIFIEFR